MTDWNPAQRVMVVGLGDAPRWYKTAPPQVPADYFNAEYIDDVMSVSITGGRTTYGVQADLPTATIKVLGKTADWLADRYLYIHVANLDVTVTERDPIPFWPDNDNTRHLGRIVEITQEWIPVGPAGTLTPVSTIKTSSLMAVGAVLAIDEGTVLPHQKYAERLQYITRPPDIRTEIRGITDPGGQPFILDADIPMVSNYVSWPTGSPGWPWDHTDPSLSPQLLAERITGQTNSLDLLRDTARRAGDVLRYRRTGQAWTKLDPTRIPSVYGTITNPHIVTLTGAPGYSLLPIVTRAVVNYGPTWADGQAEYAGQVIRNTTTDRAAVYGTRTYELDSELIYQADADDVARWILTQREHPRRIMPGMTFDLTNPHMTAAERHLVLAVETGTPIGIQTGTALDELGQVIVEGIMETITPTRHRITWDVVSTEPTIYAHGGA